MGAGVRKREAHSEKTMKMHSDYKTHYCEYRAGVLDFTFK